MMTSHRFILTNGSEEGVSRRTFVKGLAIGRRFLGRSSTFESARRR
jgi:hypothetical protein